MFDISKFTSVAAQTLSNNAEMHWLYQTQDSAADIQKIDATHFNNYFGEAYSLLSEGNIITVRHMSTPDDTAATLSMTSTVIDEVDYIVIHKGEQLETNAGVSTVVKSVYVYPLQKGQRILVRKFDNSTTFTNTNVSFQSPVCVSKLGVVRLAAVTADLVLTLKQHDHGGTQLGTVTMDDDESAHAGYFVETSLANSSQCVETSFNIEGNAAAGNAPFIVYLLAESDASAHVDTLALTAPVANANQGNNLSWISPVSGRITKILVGASANATGAASTWTASIAGTAVTGGVATIAIGSASAVAIPTALNIVNAGQEITVVGTALGTAGTANVAVLIEA